MYGLILAAVAVVVIFGTIAAALTRYKKCPSNKLLVVYGKTAKTRDGDGKSIQSVAKCIHGGATFVIPVIQDYDFISLKPIQIDIDLKNALTEQNIRVNLPSSFTIGVSTQEGVMINAAERLLGLGEQEIKALAEDIIFGALRVVVATMSIEEINANRDKFIENVVKGVDVELKKVGLYIINVNTKDITDESGYIEALGKKAASEAINKAKVDVAQNDRDGASGEADAKREERVNVAKAEAEAVKGENIAKVTIANSDSERRENVADAERKAVAAEKVNSANALKEAYAAEQEAETARGEKQKATQTADIVVPAIIQKEKIQIDADAAAEKLRREARGKGDAKFFEMEGQAKGILEILTKQAEGLEKIVEAAGGNAKDAAMLMIVDKLPEIVKMQVEAIKGIKIDKVVVWDGMGGGNGKPATANFLAGMLNSVPPLNDLFKMAGMALPELLGSSLEKGTEKEESAETVEDIPADTSFIGTGELQEEKAISEA